MKPGTIKNKSVFFSMCGALAMLLAFTTLHAQPKTFHVFNQLDQAPPGSPLPASNAITAVFIDGNTAWLGTGKGLSSSADGGKTWQNYYNTPAFGSETVSAIGVQQVPGPGKKVIWAATAHNEEVNTGLQNQSVPVGTGLRYRYFFGGDTNWHTIPQPLDSASASTIQYGYGTNKTTYSALPVTVAEDNLVYDLAITPSGNVFIASFAGGLRETTDNGATWRLVLLPGDNMEYLTPDQTYSNLQLNPTVNFNDRVFSVIALSDSELFVGTAGGINKSTDGGVSWRKMNHQKFPGISGNFVVKIARQPSTGTIWAATIDADKSADPSEERAVSYSRDDGKTWTTADAFRGYFTHSFGFLDDMIYAAADTGLFRSCDNGLSWTVQNLFTDPVRRERITTQEVFAAGARAVDSALFIGTGDGLVISKASCAQQSVASVLEASAHLLSASQTYAYPNPFSPAQGVTRIHYRVDEPGITRTGKVTIEIYDFALNPVRTVIRNAERSNDGELDEIWDGMTDGGTRAANGVYHYSVRVDGGDRRWGKILVIN